MNLKKMSKFYLSTFGIMHKVSSDTKLWLFYILLPCSFKVLKGGMITTLQCIQCYKKEVQL